MKRRVAKKVVSNTYRDGWQFELPVGMAVGSYKYLEIPAYYKMNTVKKAWQVMVRLATKSMKKLIEERRQQGRLYDIVEPGCTPITCNGGCNEGGCCGG